MKIPKIFWKAAILFIMGYILLSLAHWFLTDQPLLVWRLGNYVNLMVSHIDVSTLSAVETFMLANVTAFIAVYDFLNARQRERKKKTPPTVPSRKGRHLSCSRTPRQSRRSERGRFQKRPLRKKRGKAC